MDTTPASLLQRLRSAPDPESWARLADLCSPFLHAWALRLGLSPADAADLVQDVFVLLLRKLPQFDLDPSKSFRAWLRSVAVNRWRETLRKRRPTAELPDVPAEAESLWESDFRDSVVSRALALMRSEFAEPTWRAFWQTTAEGRPALEVAAGLGLTLNAVYLARSRVLRRLRAQLGGMLD